MPRTRVKGRQVENYSITDVDLAIDSVITEKIKDGNVTCVKLEPGLCNRLLQSAFPIGRAKIMANITANTDFPLPNGLTYDLATFVDRVAIYRNGQLLFNGSSPPTNIYDPVEVYPGSDTTKIKFDMDLKRGETIQVIIL